MEVVEKLFPLETHLWCARVGESFDEEGRGTLEIAAPAVERRQAKEHPEASRAGETLGAGQKLAEDLDPGVEVPDAHVGLDHLERDVNSRRTVPGRHRLENMTQDLERGAVLERRRQVARRGNAVLDDGGGVLAEPEVPDGLHQAGVAGAGGSVADRLGDLSMKRPFSRRGDALEDALGGGIRAPTSTARSPELLVHETAALQSTQIAGHGGATSAEGTRELGGGRRSAKEADSEEQVSFPAIETQVAVRLR